MNDHCIQLRSSASAERRIIRKDMVKPMTLRSWRMAPDTVCIQIRLKSEIVTAYISLDQARAFAANILAATGEIK